MIRKLWHFIGSVTFAIGLLAASTLIVIVGTILESVTDSHLFAAQWSYHHPLFLFLLGLVFINILVSALRRYPFQLKHIPFLLTHLGLLMVIAGVIFKGLYGVQGRMLIAEGTGTDRITIPHTRALSIQEKGKEQQTIPLTKLPRDIQVEAFVSNVSQSYEYWIKTDHANISGAPPLPVYEWDETTPLPLSARLFLEEGEPIAWNVYAIRSDSIAEAKKRLIVQKGKVNILNETLPLQTLVNEGVDIKGTYIKATVEENALHFSIEPSLGISYEIQLPLNGNQTLEPKIFPYSELIEHPISIEIKQPPSLLILKNTINEEHLIALGKHGELWEQEFSPDHFTSLYSYDDGFKGYEAEALIPLSIQGFSQKERARSNRRWLEETISHSNLPHLFDPFCQACEDLAVDPSMAAADFFFTWKEHPLWIFSSFESLQPDTKRVFEHLTVNNQNLGTITLFQGFLDQLKVLSVEQTLQTAPWKDLFEDVDEDQFYIRFHEAGRIVPIEAKMIQGETKAKLFSATLREYGFDLAQLLDGTEEDKQQRLLAYRQEKGMQPPKEVSIRSPLSLKMTPLPSNRKLEDNRPVIALKIGKDQLLSLPYDPTGKALPWPTENNETLLRFQPEEKQLPFRVRLHQAKRTNYPGSNDPLHYECTLFFCSADGSIQHQAILSMNRVYETNEGYRFYLAGIHPGTSGDLQSVQLAVNYDPAKWILTYPGGIILVIGIVLLFWFRRN